MNLDNVINKLNLTLTELEQSGIPANEIEKIKFHLLNSQKVTNEVAAELAPEILISKIEDRVTKFLDNYFDEYDDYRPKLAVCISNANYNLLLQDKPVPDLSYYKSIYITNLEHTLNIKLYSVSKMSDHVIAIGVA